MGTLSEMSDRDQFSLYSEVEPLQQSFQHQEKKYCRYLRNMPTTEHLTSIRWCLVFRMEKQKSEESSDSMQSTIRRVETQWEQYRLSRQRERRTRERWKCFYLGNSEVNIQHHPKRESIMYLCIY